MEKSRVQNIADAAALAGAMDLPNYSIAINSAKKVYDIVNNEFPTDYEGPNGGSSKLIE